MTELPNSDVEKKSKKKQSPPKISTEPLPSFVWA